MEQGCDTTGQDLLAMGTGRWRLFVMRGGKTRDRWSGMTIQREGPQDGGVGRRHVSGSTTARVAGSLLYCLALMPLLSPEQRARERIDQMLLASGWAVQDKKSLNPSAALGVAVREYDTDLWTYDQD